MDSLILKDCFKNLSSDRLKKIGVNSDFFTVIEDLNKDEFDEIKVKDNIIVVFKYKKYFGQVAYKYRDKKDVKIEIKKVEDLE